MRNNIKDCTKVHDSKDFKDSSSLLNKQTPEPTPKNESNFIDLTLKIEKPPTNNPLPFSFSAVRKKIKEPELTDFINNLKLTINNSRNNKTKEKVIHFNTQPNNKCTTNHK